MIKNKFLLLFYLSLFCSLSAQIDDGFRIARLKYGGGGDWYNDPSAEINLLNFIALKTKIKTVPEYTFVEASSDELFSFPMLFITGHGNIVLNDSEITNLKKYLQSGGFIYIDDDYGFNKSIRRELKKIYPEKELIELPFSHKIYNCFFNFPYGPPKIHEHDNNPPRGFGLYINNRLAIFYTYESNPSDGWADKIVHNDSDQKRLEALKFGTNLIYWLLTN